MKTRFVFLLTITALLLTHVGKALGQGTAFKYQGRLNTNGSPAYGSYALRFAVYDAATNGTQQGVALMLTNVSVKNGLFTSLLDFGTDIFTGPDRWLQIGVYTNEAGDFTLLSPRQLITPTPYAITARNLTGTLPTTQLSGILPAAQFIGTYPNAVTFNNAGSSFSGNGAGLAGVNAATLGGLGASSFWQPLGNSGTTPGVNFLGTTDNHPLEIKVNGQRAFRFEPTAGSPNLIGGLSVNYADAGVIGATISGGGESNAPNAIQGNAGSAMYDTIGGGSGNLLINSRYSTIGGGSSNSMNYGGFDTIAGGANNSVALGPYPGALNSIGGGEGNQIDGASGSAIAGGRLNDIAESSPSSIGGGAANFIAQSDYGAIGGGYDNAIAICRYATIGGGLHNSNWADDSTISGGANNIIRDAGAVIGGGSDNQIHSNDATIAGGSDNVIFASYATIAGGSENTIDSDAVGATVGGGQGNSVASAYGTIPGGTLARASNYGEMAYASGQFATAGDAQTSVLVCRRTTMNSTTTELCLDGISKRMTLSPNSSWGFDILVTGRAASGDTAAYQFLGAAENKGGITLLLAPPKKTVIAEDLASWDANMFAPGTNGALVINVNGQAATSIRWVATVRAVEVTY